MRPVTARTREDLEAEFVRLSMARVDAKKRGDTARAQVCTRRLDDILDELHTLTGTFADAGPET